MGRCVKTSIFSQKLKKDAKFRIPFQITFQNFAKIEIYLNSTETSNVSLSRKFLQKIISFHKLTKNFAEIWMKFLETVDWSNFYML